MEKKEEAEAETRRPWWGLRRIYEEDPERFRQIKAKSAAALRETVRKERLRMIHGLPRKTRMRLNAVAMTRRMWLHRWRMKTKRNYFYADGHPTWICHDKATRRSPRMEATATRIGLRVVAATEGETLEHIRQTEERGQKE